MIDAAVVAEPPGPLAGGGPYTTRTPNNPMRSVTEELMSTRPIIAIRRATATTAGIAFLALVLLGCPNALGAARPARASAPAATRPLTSILGVLRRPQTAADRDPALIRQLQAYYHHNKYASVRMGLEGLPVLSLMRLATVTPWGQRIYVVPFLPPTVAQKRRLPRRYRIGGERVATPTTVTLWIFPTSDGRSTDFFGGGAGPAFIKGGRALGNGAYDTKLYDHPRQVIMVVPDGVARVALWYPVGSIAKHPNNPIAPGSKPVIATVHDNIAAFIAPRRFERPHDFFALPGQEIWYGSHGNVVNRIDNASSCMAPLGSCA